MQIVLTHKPANYPRFGRALVTRQLSFTAVVQTGDAEVYVAILSLVRAELLLQEKSGKDYAEVIATYLSFRKLCSTSGVLTLMVVFDVDKYPSETIVVNDLDACITKCCRSSTLPEFSSILDLLYEGFSAMSLNQGHLVNLIHVSDIIMRHAPEGLIYVLTYFLKHAHVIEGSLKLLQIHLSKSLAIFAELAATEGGNHLRESMLNFMGNQFNDRVSRSERDVRTETSFL